MTLPGTNAPHSAVTRGKPSLFVFIFSLPGLFEPGFFGTSFSLSLKCLFWFSWVFCDIFGVFLLAGSSTGGFFSGFSSVILNCFIFWLAFSGYLVYLSLFPSLDIINTIFDYLLFK